MAHYAKVDNNIVIQVIKAEDEFFDTFVDSTPGDWIQTSYNTSKGLHSKGGIPLRKNYASVGMTYDATRDAFIPPKSYPSWTLDEASCQWQPPTAMPDDGKEYKWNEETTAWDKLV